jgi:hypothetical protein
MLMAKQKAPDIVNNRNFPLVLFVDRLYYEPAMFSNSPRVQTLKTDLFHFNKGTYSLYDRT